MPCWSIAVLSVRDLFGLVATLTAIGGCGSTQCYDVNECDWFEPGVGQGQSCATFHPASDPHPDVVPRADGNARYADDVSGGCMNACALRFSDYPSEHTITGCSTAPGADGVVWLQCRWNEKGCAHQSLGDRFTK